MKKFLGLLVIGALTMLAFPGHHEDLRAQGVAPGQPPGQPPVSTNPEIAALQAQASILAKQLGILNQKMDQVLAKLQLPAPPQTSGAGPLPEPVPPPKATGPAVGFNPDGTVLIDGRLFLPASTAGACGPAQTTVSLMADACGGPAGAATGATSCGSAAGTAGGGFVLFPRLRAWRAKRLSGGAGACGG